MEMNLDSIVAAAAVTVIIVNVIGTMALIIAASVQDILRARQRRLRK